MNRKETALSVLAAFSIIIVLGGLQIAFTAGQTYPQTNPAVPQEQAVQLALQEAQTLNLTPFFGDSLPVQSQVDHNPSNITFYYSFGVYPKWQITFNATFYWVTGHCPGSIQVQVAADTGEIDNTSVTTAPINETTPTASPSENPTATPSPTPNIAPTPTPTASPTPTAAPQPKGNSPVSAATLILVAVLVSVVFAGMVLAMRLRRTKHTE